MLNKTKSKVDIIIPTYNPGDYLFNTIKSIINQTFQDWRILLIDDGSSVQYAKKIQKISKIDNRITLIVLFKNHGGGYARNVGLKHVSSDYLAFCDSDDKWPPDKLKRQWGFMDKRININITHCDMLRIKNGGAVKVETPDVIDIDEFLSNTQLFCSSVLLRTSVIKDAKFGQMKARHPFKFWCSILSNGEKSYNVKDTYFEYLVRNDSVSSNKLKMLYYTIIAYFLYAPTLKGAVIGMFYRVKRLDIRAK